MTLNTVRLIVVIFSLYPPQVLASLPLLGQRVEELGRPPKDFLGTWKIFKHYLASIYVGFLELENLVKILVLVQFLVAY